MISSSKKHRKLKKGMRMVGALGVGLVGVAVDVPLMLSIAVAKTPMILFLGWKKQVIDMDHHLRDNTCSCPVCFPTTSAVLIGWPLMVAASIPKAVCDAFYNAYYSARIAYKEKSLARGLEQVVSSIDVQAHAGFGVSCFGPLKSVWKDIANESGTLEAKKDVMLIDAVLEFMATPEEEENIDLNKMHPDMVAKAYLYDYLMSCEFEEQPEDMVGNLGRQMQIEKLRPDEVDYLESLVFSSDQLGKPLGTSEVRVGMLEGFGRRIRGIASYIAKDQRFKLLLREKKGGRSELADKGKQAFEVEITEDSMVNEEKEKAIVKNESFPDLISFE